MRSRGHAWPARLSPAAGAGRESWKKNPEEGGWQEVGGGGVALEQAGLNSLRTCLECSERNQGRLPEARFALDRQRGGLGQGPVMCELQGPQGCPQRAGTQRFCCSIHSSLPRGEPAGSLAATGLCRLCGNGAHSPLHSEGPVLLAPAPAGFTPLGCQDVPFPSGTNGN